MPQMDEQEVNEYLNKLLSGKIKLDNPLENEALKKFQQCSAELAQTQNRLGNMQSEMEVLRNKAQQTAGQRQAYVSLLVSAENLRRAPKFENDENKDKPLKLSELKDKLGADKVEAFDKGGKLIDSSEGETDEQSSKGEQGQGSPNPSGKPEGAGPVPAQS